MTNNQSNEKNNQDASKSTWQPPQVKKHQFLTNEIQTGADAINENHAAGNFLGS